LDDTYPKVQRAGKTDFEEKKLDKDQREPRRKKQFDTTIS
jgi:hypothetical protein